MIVLNSKRKFLQLKTIPMFLIIIVSTLILINLLLLKFSCNKSANYSKSNKKQRTEHNKVKSFKVKSDFKLKTPFTDLKKSS